MEEISSLDSFHTDAGSTARPDSEPPKPDEDISQASAAEKPAAEDEGEEGTKDTPTEGAQLDEDFEQISEGSFEVDENSRATSAGPPPPDEGSTQNTQTNEEKDEKAPEEEEPSVEQQSSKGGAEDFEEVDAHVSTSGNTAAIEESDMLGESDMTLPMETAQAERDGDAEAEHDEGDTNADEADGAADEGDKSVSGMEVDHDEEEEGEAEAEAVPTPGDVEMPSASNSPAQKEHDKSNEQEEESGGQIDASMEEEGGDNDDKEGKDEVDETSDEVAKDKDPEAAEEDDRGGEEADAETELAEKEGEGEIGDDEEGEHEDDEPVENVQEPEESDVCLIPDDTETQVTDAEKEKAILARENAEKEDAEKAAEKEKEKEKEKEAAEAAKEGAEKDQEATTDTAALGPAQAVEAGAQAADADAGSGSSEETPPAEASDAHDPDEPLLEEIQSAAGESGATPKIIVAWIVSSSHKCKQCGTEKSCGFRYKNPESGEFEYVCEQACCEALLADNPGKYFIRRKKFLVEELTITESQTAEASEEGSIAADTTTEGEEAASEKPSEDADNSEAEANAASSTVAPNTHNCLQCKESKPCKYFFKQDEEQFYICNDDCYNLLNAEEPDKFKLKRHSIRVRNIGATTISSPASTQKSASRETGVVARTAAEAEAARLERNASFTRRCAECFKEVTLGDKNLLWETMDFCNELCLGKYQRTIGANCQTCNGEVPHPALGKYCVRFGFDIRQFCCAACLNEYKKGLKTCSCCQKDISSGSEGFLAPVGDKEQFKDFCSQACMRRYDSMCNAKKKLRNDVCAVCNHDKPVRVEIMLDGKEHTFCSNPCFSAFKFVSNIVADQCGMCSKYFERKGAESYTIYTERRAKVFCSRICLNVYITVNRRIVSCQWCKVKKYNFDMIYKQHDAQEVLMCSLNCLTLYGVSINAFSRTVAKCDNCNNSATPQYHLTMSDASMRNFCTYQCVMQFQSQFARAPLTLESDAQSQSAANTTSAGSSKNSTPFPTGLPKRVKLKQQTNLQIKLPVKSNSSSKKLPAMPVISTVSSLASGETESMIGNVTVRRGRGRGRKVESPPPLVQIAQSGGSGRGRPRKNVEYTRSPSPVSLSPPRTSTTKRPGAEKSSVSTETKIIAVPPYPPAVRNVQTSCKPNTVTVGFQTQPSTMSTAVQTGKDYSNKVLIPVPVPIFLPQPMYMYSAPFPVPVPIPLPIPVPIFIPTTRNSAQGILKEIKKIQDKMPADPFEAELLMMAEMVAEEKHESDSDSDEEIKPDPGMVNMQYGNSVQPVEGSNSYGEEVLQMALKMATGEYDQPTVDLESALTANTIADPPPGMVGHDDSMSHMSGHHMQQQQHHVIEPQRAGRGRKRGAIAAPVSPRNNRSPAKRQRLQEMEPPQQQVPQPVQTTEKPDANMCLKYTFGVNAWRQWVMTKNADIEKSSIRRRPFKTELLQMTADELNYSLCLFVKEVRKPNGTEYAPDTIYYLVLGIQQYLYENGRIDNIFTDPYYERFTDCLDEVARKFSVLYNDSQYIVTRVEEEHLWECKQLGAHSPHVLLSTLMFFNTKHFNLTTVEEHMQLSFSHIMKHWKRSAQNAKTPGTRNVLLRFYPPQAGLDANPRKKKVYEQQENEDNPLRCPVRLYEFYLSKCPESVKTRNDVFYLQPERSCVPDSPVWYSTQALSQEALQKMLHRVKMVKEINIALLTS